MAAPGRDTDFSIPEESQILDTVLDNSSLRGKLAVGIAAATDIVNAFDARPFGAFFAAAVVTLSFNGRVNVSNSQRIILIK